MLDTQQTRRSQQARGFGTTTLITSNPSSPANKARVDHDRASGTTDSKASNGYRAGWRSPIDGAVELRQGADHVLHVQLHRRVREVARRVGRSLFRQLDSMNPGPGQFGGYGLATAPDPVPSSTTTGKASRFTARDRVDHRTQLFDRPAGHDFGLGSGHEDTRTYLKFQVAKVSPTGQVLQRHPMRALVDQRLEVRGLGILDGIEQRKPSQLDSCCVRQQLPSSCPATRRRPRAAGSQPDAAAVEQPCSRAWATDLGEPQLGVGLLSALITASRSPFRT